MQILSNTKVKKLVEALGEPGFCIVALKIKENIWNFKWIKKYYCKLPSHMLS